MIIKHHWELEVYKHAMQGTMDIFHASKKFPKEEMYSLTDQIRRSSRSVASGVAEAWRRRRYEAVFLNKLNEVEGEAAETQVWLEISVKCGYLAVAEGRRLHKYYDEILGMIVTMINDPVPWILRKTVANPRTKR